MKIPTFALIHKDQHHVAENSNPIPRNSDSAYLLNVLLYIRDHHRS